MVLNTYYEHIISIITTSVALIRSTVLYKGPHRNEK